ncbi:EamA family transporter [Candidatus Woesearchaeota archaeon]|nr:EamA family transporter [Candidatus Woesearchaeota archaeon]
MLWVLYSLGAAVMQALCSLIDKKVMLHEHALEYGAARGFFSLFLIVAFPFIDLYYNWTMYVSIYVISIILITANLYYLRSVRHSELSSSIPLMNISPLFLLVVAYLLLGEKPGVVAVIGILLLVVGTYLLQAGVSPGKKGLLAPFRVLLTSRYSLYMIFAILIYSFTATLLKAVVGWGVDAVSVVVLTLFFMGINYVFLEVVKHGVGEIFRDLRRDGRIIFFSFISGLLSNLFLLLAMAVPGALVSLIIPIKRTSTFLTALIGGRLFHEHRLGVKLLACAVMVAGVVLIVL